ncbi:hypothetical protein LHY41_004650 [Salmonella enterica]|nr:hypothetical protein [Salmonella enterica]
MACGLAQPAGTESPALDRQSHHVFAPAAESGPDPRLAEKRRTGRRETTRFSGMDGKETDVARCALPAIQSYLNMRCLSQKKQYLLLSSDFWKRK